MLEECLQTVRRWLGRQRFQQRDRAAWNREYAAGNWDFLSSLEESARYWIAVGYCSRIKTPSILDVGCGTGVLEEKLRLLPYSTYLGVDFSVEALRTCRRNMPDNCRLVCSDMATFEVREAFDIILFMELDLRVDSISLLKRYQKMMKPGGKILISLFDGRKTGATSPVWDEIRRHFRIEDSTRIENLPSGKRWTIAWISAEFGG